MDDLKITTSYKSSMADIMARVLTDGDVDIWYHFIDSGQNKYEVNCTPEEWDRLVAWVEWQRKELAVNKGQE